MTDSELLLALSDMLDKKLRAELQPMKNNIQDIKDEVHNIKLFQENVILLKVDTIKSCYTDTYMRYRDYVDKVQSAFSNIE